MIGRAEFVRKRMMCCRDAGAEPGTNRSEGAAGTEASTRRITAAQHGKRNFR
jgi:hypothetical protein